MTKSFTSVGTGPSLERICGQHEPQGGSSLQCTVAKKADMTVGKWLIITYSRVWKLVAMPTYRRKTES